MPFMSNGEYIPARRITTEYTKTEEEGLWRCWESTCRCRIPSGETHWCHCHHVFCADHIDEEDHDCTNLKVPDDEMSVLFQDVTSLSVERGVEPSSEAAGDRAILPDTHKPGLFDAAEFAPLVEVAKHWEEIRAELEALHGEGFILWPERDLYSHKGDGTGWNVYGFYSFGNKIEENCARCPATTRLVESVPGMKMAGFSLLKADSHISPHKGYAEYSESIYRAHLGLVVPPCCRLRCAAQTSEYREGEWLVFDDTQLHEAWNEHETETRIVLLMDFETPPGYKTASVGLLGFTHGAAHLSGREAGDHVAHIKPPEDLPDVSYLPGMGTKQW